MRKVNRGSQVENGKENGKSRCVAEKLARIVSFVAQAIGHVASVEKTCQPFFHFDKVIFIIIFHAGILLLPVPAKSIPIGIL